MVGLDGINTITIIIKNLHLYIVQNYILLYLINTLYSLVVYLHT